MVTAACISMNCTVLEQLGMSFSIYPFPSEPLDIDVDRLYPATKNLTSIECGIIPTTHYIFEPFLIVFIMLTCVFFSLRIVSRLLLGGWWWDDLFTSFAVVSPLPNSTIAAHLSTNCLKLSCWSYTAIMLYGMLKYGYLRTDCSVLYWFLCFPFFFLPSWH